MNIVNFQTGWLEIVCRESVEFTHLLLLVKTLAELQRSSKVGKRYCFDFADAQTTNPETPSEAKQDLPGPSSSSSKESLLPDPPDPDLAMDAFQRIPESYLEHLINLLGLRKMQAAASLRVFSIIYQLAKREPRLSEPLIRILRHRLDRYVSFPSFRSFIRYIVQMKFCICFPDL